MFKYNLYQTRKYRCSRPPILIIDMSVLTFPLQFSNTWPLLDLETAGHPHSIRDMILLELGRLQWGLLHYCNINAK